VNMRKTLAGAAALAVAGGLVAATPGHAADGTTVATFEIKAGALAITVPTGTTDTPKNLGQVSIGTAVFAPSLGDVTVSDSRTNLATAWTATVKSTDFVTDDGGAANEKVLASEISYVALPGLSVAGVTGTGTGTFTGGTVASLDAESAAAELRMAGKWVGTGANDVKWTPTVTFSGLDNNVAGIYKGTITHSVL
jgi:hypothetical protein